MRPAAPEDRTARARIRDAALTLFARHGYAGTSIRAIATAANVSPALITHHFGTKDALRGAVDEHVARLLGAAFDEIHPDQPAEELMRAFAATSARLFGADPGLRGYFRQVLLTDSPSRTSLYERLLQGATEVRDRFAAAGALRPDADHAWTPFALLLFAIGPLMFEPLLPADAFEPDVLAARSAAFQQILLRGLLPT